MKEGKPKKKKALTQKQIENEARHLAMESINYTYTPETLNEYNKGLTRISDPVSGVISSSCTISCITPFRAFSECTCSECTSL